MGQGGSGWRFEIKLQTPVHMGRDGCIEDLTQVLSYSALPDSAEILEPIGVYRPEVDSARPVTNEGLEVLGFEEGEKASNMADGERKLRVTIQPSG